MKVIGILVSTAAFFFSFQLVWADQSTEASGASDFEKAAELSDDEKTRTAERYLSEMKGILTHVMDMLKEVRKEKDVIKLNCINDKLTSIKGLVRISGQAEIALLDAIQAGENESAIHEFHKIAISHQKVKILKTEAEQCVGELAFVIGDTSVEVEKDGDVVPADDPTEIDFEDTEIIRPPAASPYQ